MREIFNQVEQFESDFYNKNVTIVQGYNFNQYKTVKRVHLYYNGQFENVSDDDRHFHNLSKGAVRNAVKNLDLDTKDLQIISENPVKDWLKTLVARKKVKRLLKMIKMGKKMNDCTRSLAKMGSLVIKYDKNSEQKFSVVDLRNLVNDPTVESLNDSTITIENHYYTPIELRQKKGWKDVDFVIDAYKGKKNADRNSKEGDGSISDDYINVKEVYAEVPESWMKEDGNEDKFVLGMFIMVMNGKKGSRKKGDVEGWVLHQQVVKERPYKEIHVDKMEGRWLGIGFVEDQFEVQVRKNEIVNLRVQAIRLAVTAVFQTRDETIANNILTDLANGDILGVNDFLTRVPTEIRDHSAFIAEENDIGGLSNRLANSFEVTTGESLPSGTPFSLGALLDRNVNKYFGFIRENYGLFWKEVFNDWVIPDVMDDIDAEEILEITDMDQVKKINKEFRKIRIWAAIKNFILTFGRKPTMKEIELAQQYIIQQDEEKSTFLEIPKGYFKDFKFSINLVVTDEDFNKQERLITGTSLLQLFGQNPGLLENPQTKSLVYQILDLSGYSMADFGDQIQQAPQGQDVQGVGGVEKALSKAGEIAQATVPETPSA